MNQQSLQSIELTRNLENYLHDLEYSLDFLEEEQKQNLLDISNKYSSIVSKYIQINDKKQRLAKPHPDTRIKLLKNIPIFSGLKPAILELLARQMEELVIEQNNNLLTQDKDADGVYILEEGSVEIIVNGEMVALRGKGDCFGEMSCLRGETKASATVRTTCASKVLKIPREEFVRTISKTQQLWQNVFTEMTDRFKDINHRLSEVLQHTPQSLMKIDTEGKITEEFSSHCIEFFGTSQLVGIPFHELVFANDSIALDGWIQIFPLFFEDDLMEFTDLAELLPKETVYKHPDGSNRYYVLSYYPCENPENQILAIDIGIEDVTMARELSLKSKALEEEREITKRLYDSPELYLYFLDLAKETVQHLDYFDNVLQKSSDTSKLTEIDELMRILHSLKGSSSMFALEKMKNECHEMENILKTFQDSPQFIDSQIQLYRDGKDKLKKSYSFARSLIDQLSDELQFRLKGVVLTQEDFTHLLKIAEEGKIEEVNRMLKKVQKIPVKKMMQYWPHEVRNLAKKLGKIADIQINTGNCSIPQDIFQKLDSSLIHIMRNAVDHGLERPEERIALGKSEEGLIIVDVFEENGLLEISITDDGHGIDYQKIIAKAKNNQKIDQKLVDKHIKEEEVWKILFLPGFSMAETLTDVSGRGVGMDVVQNSIEELNGNIEIITKINQGTVFVIKIPLES